MAAPLVGAAAVSGISGLLSSIFSGAGKKKERKHQEKMLKEERAWQEKMRSGRWAEQERRSDKALGRLAPEQGYMPTYQGLRETAPLLTKLIGGNIGRYFGDEAMGDFGTQDILGKIAQPGYTGFEQEQSYAEKAGSEQATIPKEGSITAVKKEGAGKHRRVPQYFKERYGGR